MTGRPSTANCCGRIDLSAVLRCRSGSQTQRLGDDHLQHHPGVGTENGVGYLINPLLRLLGALIAGRCPKFCCGRSADGPGDGADPAADTVRWSWPTPTMTRAVSPQEIIEVFRLDEGAAAGLNERQFASLDQRVERGGADAAQLLRAP